MSASIKNLCANRLVANLQALKTNGAGVREVARRSDSLVNATVFPSIHVAVGNETPAPVEEDNRGYTLDFPINVKITAADYRNRPDTLDELVAQAQTIIEADLTLGGYATWIRYVGDHVFYDEASKPIGGIVLFYDCQYRRLRGDPRTTY